MHLVIEFNKNKVLRPAKQQGSCTQMDRTGISKTPRPGMARARAVSAGIAIKTSLMVRLEASPLTSILLHRRGDVCTPKDYVNNESYRDTAYGAIMVAKTNQVGLQKPQRKNGEYKRNREYQIELRQKKLTMRLCFTSGVQFVTLLRPCAYNHDKKRLHKKCFSYRSNYSRKNSAKKWTMQANNGKSQKVTENEVSWFMSDINFVTSGRPCHAPSRKLYVNVFETHTHCVPGVVKHPKNTPSNVPNPQPRSSRAITSCLSEYVALVREIRTAKLIP